MYRRHATLLITLDGVGLTQHEFTGTVDGDRIAGTVKVGPPDGTTMTSPFRARRTATSRYFAPTGTGTLPPAGQMMFDPYRWRSMLKR
jgi:hypothetical protein